MFKLEKVRFRLDKLWFKLEKIGLKLEKRLDRYLNGYTFNQSALKIAKTRSSGFTSGEMVFDFISSKIFDAERS